MIKLDKSYGEDGTYLHLLWVDTLMSTAKVISWCDLRTSYCDTKRYSNQWRTRGHTRILKMWQKIVFLKIHWRSMFSVCTYVIFSFTFFIILIFMPWTNSFFCHTISALIPNALKACFFCCFFSQAYCTKRDSYWLTTISFIIFTSNQR